MVDFITGWAGLILGFSGLIFIHELGHFVLAKWNGVRVYVFSLGMGPYIFSFTWRGTVYALSLIPIGGYVKLMGQDDLNPNSEPSKDNSDYRNKRPGQKAAILAAGAAFNLAFTIVAFTICYGVGMYVEPPIIGNISPGSKLAEALEKPTDKSLNEMVPAKLQKGDRILEVNQVPVKTFLEAMLQISGTPNDSMLELKVERQPAESGDIALVYVKTKKDEKLGASSIGLEKYSEKVKLPLGFSTFDVIGLSDKPMSGRPAAEAGLLKGDEIISVNNEPIRETIQLTNMINGSEGKELVFKIRRKGDEKTINVTPKIAAGEDKYRMGAAVGPVKRRVSEIDQTSEVYKAGLREGHLIVGFKPDDANAEVWTRGTIMWQERDLGLDDKTKPKTAVVTIPEAGKLAWEVERPKQQKYKAETIGAAIATAWDDTVRFSGSVFTVIRGLITRDISTNAMSSFVGIGGVMYTVASTQTPLNFLWFLGFISLNLGVLQFVPIPLLDGWHLLMVAIEKLKGSPVAPKIQEAFQYVGLFIVGSLLLLATYNDISRMFFQ
jgi:regulator of sigma E protease